METSNATYTTHPHREVGCVLIWGAGISHVAPVLSRVTQGLHKSHTYILQVLKRDQVYLREVDTGERCWMDHLESS